MRSPESLPAVTVEVDGAELPGEGARQLAEVTVRQRLSLPAQCEIVYADPAGVFEDAPPRLGASLRVTLGETGRLLFAGEVVAIDRVLGAAGTRELRLRGYDALHRLRRRQQVRAHVQVTLAELARDLVGDLGIAVAPAEGGPVWQRIIQHDQSDLDLLRDVAGRAGLYFALDGARLEIFSLLGGEATELALRYGETLFEVRAELNAGAACAEVTAHGWTAATGETRRGRAAQARTTHAGVGEDGTRTLLDAGIDDDQQADALAQGELDRRQGSAVTLWAVAEGDPGLRPGRRIVLSGVPDDIAGRYVPTAVRHTLRRHQGYLCEIETEPPPETVRRRGTLATPARVTAVDDPDGLGRVRVALTAFEDVESGWLQVVQPAAGADKGLAALPEVDDLVLALLRRDDLAQGFVLGGLYGLAGPPAPCVEDGAVKRYVLATRGGQRVTLDDAGTSLRVETRGGSYIDLGPERLHLHAASDLLIEAPGRAIKVRGRAIDFERG